MNLRYLLVLILFGFTACSSDQDKHATSTPTSTVAEAYASERPIALVLHGGAGAIQKEFMSDSLEQAYLHILDSTITLGHELLQNGVPAIDVVCEVIMVLENSPLFNAGRGAVFTHEETNELDASIMDGATQNAGAIAGVHRIKNPILLAKAVMEQSEHVMLAGQGAEEFAVTLGMDLIDPAYFRVEARLESLRRVKAKEGQQASNYDPYIKDSKFGTVGCVALDKTGNIVAGTSTGGMTNKRWNRIGDAPIIGAGTYANSAVCGVSSTGWGEYFIRAVVAYDIAALIDYKGLSLEEAARLVIHEKVPALGGDGGVVALDKLGRITMQFNTAGMYRAGIDGEGVKTVAIYE
jgi:beta-aspartyl-peptidase (threonine type)